MKRSSLVSGFALLLAAGAAAAAENFVFEVSKPDFRVTLPGIPRMVMRTHPMNGSRPHLRYLGTEGPYTVSVMTPTADAGMTALECASATLRSLARRPGVPPLGQVYRARLDEHTYVAMYASRIPGGAQLHAHFLSAAGGTHCVEVHASKISTSPDDVKPWFAGFGKATIEPR